MMETTLTRAAIIKVEEETHSFKINLKEGINQNKLNYPHINKRSS